MKLSERIKECRLHSDLTQEQVAEALNVSRQAVTKWENGQSAPSTENLFRLAQLFGTTVDLILEDANDRKTEQDNSFFAKLHNKHLWISICAGFALLLIVTPYRQSVYIPVVFNFICVVLDIWSVFTFGMLLYKQLSRQSIGDDMGMYCGLLFIGGIGHGIFAMMFWGCWLCLGLTVFSFIWLLMKKWKENLKNKEKST